MRFISNEIKKNKNIKKKICDIIILKKMRYDIFNIRIINRYG